MNFTQYIFEVKISQSKSIKSKYSVENKVY